MDAKYPLIRAKLPSRKMFFQPIQACDRWIGWDEVKRKQHLPRLLNNSRFLILPWVRVLNLASHVLALSLRTVADDWEHHYGFRPWLAETFVDTSRFTGHCYRAANWIDVVLTTGRGRPDRDHQRHGTAPKRVLLYPCATMHGSACSVTQYENCWPAYIAKVRRERKRQLGGFSPLRLPRSASQAYTVGPSAI